MVKKKAARRKAAAKKAAQQPSAQTPAPATIQPKDKADLLLNHYNDTYAYLWEHWLVRNRLFFYLVVLLFLMAVEVASHDSLTSLVTAYLNAKLKSGSAPPPLIQFEIISSASWFALLCLVIHYYQRSMIVDRQYRYLWDLEKRLCGLLDELAIYREGYSYYSRQGHVDSDGVNEENKRPLFLNWVGAVYTVLFPVVLILLVALKLSWEYWKMGISICGDGNINWSFTFDIIIGAIIVGYTVAYIVHGKHLSRKRIAELFPK